MGEGGRLQRKYVSPQFFLLLLTTLPSGGFLTIKVITNSTCAVHGLGIPLGQTHIGHTRALTHFCTCTGHATHSEWALGQLLDAPFGRGLVALGNTSAPPLPSAWAPLRSP